LLGVKANKSHLSLIVNAACRPTDVCLKSRRPKLSHLQAACDEGRSEFNAEKAMALSFAHQATQTGFKANAIRTAFVILSRIGLSVTILTAKCAFVVFDNLSSRVHASCARQLLLMSVVRCTVAEPCLFSVAFPGEGTCSATANPSSLVSHQMDVDIANFLAEQIATQLRHTKQVEA
jgi:hypothetical protein